MVDEFVDGAGMAEGRLRRKHGAKAIPLFFSFIGVEMKEKRKDGVAFGLLGCFLLEMKVGYRPEASLPQQQSIHSTSIEFIELLCPFSLNCSFHSLEQPIKGKKKGKAIS